MSLQTQPSTLQQATTEVRTYSRGQLLDKLQGDDYEGYERTIDSHVKNLRRKLAPEAGDPPYIATVHGVGYRLEAP